MVRVLTVNMYRENIAPKSSTFLMHFQPPRWAYAGVRGLFKPRRPPLLGIYRAPIGLPPLLSFYCILNRGSDMPVISSHANHRRVVTAV